jgi:hypothetical protein
MRGSILLERVRISDERSLFRSESAKFAEPRSSILSLCSDCSQSASTPPDAAIKAPMNARRIAHALA